MLILFVFISKIFISAVSPLVIKIFPLFNCTKLLTDDEEINKAYSNAIKENQKPKRHKRYKMLLHEKILGGIVLGVVVCLLNFHDFLDYLSFKISKLFTV